MTKEYHDDAEAWNVFHVREMVKTIEASDDFLEAELKAVNQHIATLVAEYGKGGLNISDEQMHNELKNLEMQAADFQSKLVVVRSQKNQIAGELVDQSELESSKDITDWAYIDLIISRY